MDAPWARHAAVAALVGAMVLAASARIDATESPSSAPTVVTPDQRTFATIVVNGEQRDEQIVIVKPDGVYVSIASLRASGLVIPARFGERGAESFINVKELAPEIVAVFDLIGPTLRLNAANGGSLTRSTSVSLAPVVDWTREAVAARSGYLNYSLHAGSAGLSGAQELTLSDANKTFFSGATFDAHGFHRSLTNITWLDALKRRRTMIGDVVADSGDLGSVLTLSGVTIARASDIDLDGQAHVSPMLRALVLTPSTAEVYINGQLIRTIDVAPGTVDFSNLPGSAGVTDATIVLRDSFGRTQVLSERYYGATSVLNKGATDYSYSAGEPRNGLATGPSSDKFVALGRYRLGLTQSTTIGAHAEVAGGFESLGAGVDYAGKFGTLNVSIAQSRDRAASGLAGSVAYSVGTRNVWVNATIRAATPAFTSFAQRALSDRLISDERLTIGLRPFRGPATSEISYSANRSLLGTVNRQISLQESIPLPGGIALLVTAGTAATSGGSRPTFSVFLFRSTPRSAFFPSLSASLQSDGTTLRRVVDLQRAAPPSGGTGYDVTGYGLGPMLSSGRFDMTSSIGNVDLDYGLAREGILTGNVALSGAVAFAGPYVQLSQPISDSFAIVKVTGGERVKVLLDHQEAGTTNHSGMLVVPNLRSYSAERISIERNDGPVNLDLSNADQRLVVAARHGGVADFSASLVTAVIGSVRVSGTGGNLIPAFGQLSLLSGEESATSELDRDGHFCFENVAAGSHAAIVRYAGGECRFTMDIPRTTAIEQNIGEFTCARS
jgi:outer membrane usher protein